MRIRNGFGVAALSLLLVQGCSSSDNSHTILADAGISCNGSTNNCETVPYGVCVDVQMAPGHCVDWSKNGSKACHVPSDCGVSLPSGTFGNIQGIGATTALCIRQDGTMSMGGTDAGATELGYCAALQAVIDSTGAASCANNPCGENGYCTFIHNPSGTAIVDCYWPL